MDYPRLVYIVPGREQRPGGNFGYQAVNDDDERQAALALGYFDTLPDAIDAFTNPKEASTQAKAPTQVKA